MPRPTPWNGDPRTLQQYLDRELSRIHEIFDHRSILRIPPRVKEPKRVSEGMIVHANGTNWDPGNGQGIYAYYNGTWNKLG